MARKGIEKLRCATERRNPPGYVGAEFFGCIAQLIYQCRPAVDDRNDVLEVKAHKKISVSAAFERFEPAVRQLSGRAGDLLGSRSLDQAGHDFKRVAACRMVVHVAGQHQLVGAGLLDKRTNPVSDHARRADCGA